ncbi:MAG: CehA/McbA family metallohydrolase [Planctomycetaceae bacterium]
MAHPTRGALIWLLAAVATLPLGGRADAADTPARAGVEPLPTVATAERQPLLAATTRLAEALGQAGTPLPDELLGRLRGAADDASAAQAVQTALDPLCLCAVDLTDDVPRVVPVAGPVPLVEQGWSTFLVKVINPRGRADVLALASPQAGPLPRAKREDVAARWLALAMVDRQPLAPRLSGLGLEYRIVELFAREAGPAFARIECRLGDAEPAAGTDMVFRAAPSQTVTFRIGDEPDRPAAAKIEITDAAGRIYPPQAKRLAPDLFFQRQIYRFDGETVRLPDGRYRVTCSRGPESIPETIDLEIAGRPAEVRHTVRRWIDPSRRGWWSGDHHIHAAGCAHYESPTEGVEPIDMLRQCMGEDLKVGCCLTWGPCFDYQKRFFTGRPDDVSRPPYLLRYDIEVSGFGSHVSGHLNLLRLTEQIPPGGDSKHHWPSLGLATLRWAKRQGAVCGPAHSANGLTNTVGRLPGTEGKDGPNRLPNFDIPAFDGIGANEFIVDVPHEVPGRDGQPVPAVDFISTMDTDPTAELNIWYHVLNCGYRVRASGETDFPCISGERVGLGRVYAKLDGPLTFDAWVDAIQAGRSYVSDGATHLLDYAAIEPGRGAVECGVGASEIRLAAPAELTFTVVAAARRADGGRVAVELIENGYPVARLEIASDGSERPLTFRHRVARSGWLAVRSFPGAHTNPFFVLVGGRPIRASADSARWCAAGVEQCWKTKEKSYRAEEREAARAAYDVARGAYARIEREAASAD